MITESEKQRVSFLALTLTYKVTLLNNTDAGISLHIAHVTKYFLEECEGQVSRPISSHTGTEFTHRQAVPGAGSILF